MDYQPILAEITSNIDEESQYDPELDKLDPSVKEGIYSRIISGSGSGYNYSGSWSSGSTETFLATTASGFTARRLLTDHQFTCVLKHPEEMWNWPAGRPAGVPGT